MTRGVAHDARVGGEDGRTDMAGLCCGKVPEFEMQFLSLVPPAPLGHLIESIWDWRAPRQPQRLERILPAANAGLIINLAEDQTRIYDDRHHCTVFSGNTFDGPRTRSHIIDTDEQVAVMGVVFRPAGAAVFFRERMDRIVNDSVELHDLMGRDALLLREQLLEAGNAQRRLVLLQSALQRWLALQGDEEREVPMAHALAALDADPRVASLHTLSRDLGCSTRQLGERFRQQVGMTPKRYLRLRRFQQIMALAAGRERIDWAGIAQECGYHDQAHLAHEFHEFSGMTPTSFVRQGGLANHHIAVP